MLFYEKLFQTACNTKLKGHKTNFFFHFEHRCITYCIHIKCNMRHIALQKVSFRSVKGRLLQAKRQPFSNASASLDFQVFRKQCIHTVQTHGKGRPNNMFGGGNGMSAATITHYILHTQTSQRAKGSSSHKKCIFHFAI